MAFCAGDPYADRLYKGSGSYDTVFITAAEQANLMAPVITGFLAQLRSRRRKLFRADNDYDNPGIPDRPPLTFILDELATMAPIHDLLDQLAIGNEGCLTVGVLQDYSQAKHLWGNERGRGVLTLFQNLIVFRGIKDVELLRNLSDLAGQAWVDVEGWNEGSSSSGWFDHNESSGMSMSQHQVPKLPIDRIAQGHPHYPEAVLWVRPDATHAWVHNPAYFRSLPWTPILTQVVEDIAQLPLKDPRRLLRPPRLFETADVLQTLDGRYGFSNEAFRYWRAREALDRTRRETRRLIRGTD